ncbi:MAG: hypothetical protein ACOYYS_19910 [Chloroflexota bacterium]
MPPFSGIRNWLHQRIHLFVGRWLGLSGLSHTIPVQAAPIHYAKPQGLTLGSCNN